MKRMNVASRADALDEPRATQRVASHDDSLDEPPIAAVPEPAIIHNMARTPEITVAAVTETAGRFLVVEERINRRLVFNQPAGHVEHGETLLAAVVREVREETAWGFEPQALIGVYLWRNPSSGRSTMRFAFTGSVTDHKAQQPLDRGIVCTHWLSRADLMEREQRLRSPLVLRCVEDYLGGARLPLEPVATLDLQTAPTVTAVTV
jgi:8-oxo-dGTP pyrophosphatase MutT (NUDIX family)